MSKLHVVLVSFRIRERCFRKETQNINFRLLSSYPAMARSVMSISCTPHFKDDAETAWVTQDSLTTVSLWFNPDRGLTLEDVAETIDQFVHTMPGFSSQIASCTLQSLVIRGEVFNKDSLMLSAHMAGDKLHDGEQFTVKVVKTVGVGCCAIL